MEDLSNDLFKIKNYYYQIWKYQVSHLQLILRATHAQKENHNIHITFESVRYFQFPSGWEGDFYIASDKEWSDFMMRANIGVPDAPMKEIFPSLRLYKADAKNSTIYILGVLANIEHDVEPIY